MAYDFVKEINTPNAKQKFKAAKQELVEERNAILKEWVIAQLNSQGNDKKAKEVNKMKDGEFQAYINRHPDLVGAMLQNDKINTKIDEDNQPYNHFEKRLADASKKYGEAIGALAADSSSINKFAGYGEDIILQAEVDNNLVDVQGVEKKFQKFYTEKDKERPVESYRNLKIATKISQGNPLIISLSAIDEDGLRLPSDSGLQVTLEYNAEGKLVDAIMPGPIKFAGDKDDAQAYFENEGKIYTLPFDKKGYQDITKAIKGKSKLLQVSAVRKQSEMDFHAKEFANENVPENSAINRPQSLEAGNKDDNQNNANINAAVVINPAATQVINSKNGSEYSSKNVVEASKVQEVSKLSNQKMTLEQFSLLLDPNNKNRFAAHYSFVPITYKNTSYVVDGNEVIAFASNDQAKAYIKSDERKIKQQASIRQRANEAAKIEYIAEAFNEQGVFNFNSDKQSPLKTLDDSKEIETIIKNFAKSSPDTQRDIMQKLYEIQTGKSIDKGDQRISEAAQFIVKQASIGQGVAQTVPDLVNNAPKPVNQEQVSRGPELKVQAVQPNVKQTDVPSKEQGFNNVSESAFQGVQTSSAEPSFVDVLKKLAASQVKERFSGLKKAFGIETEKDKLAKQRESEFAEYAGTEKGKEAIGKVLEDKKNLEQLMRVSVAEQRKVMENFGGRPISSEQIKERDQQSKTISITGPNSNIVLELKETRSNNDPTKGRNIDFPRALKEGEKGPISLAFALLDKEGNRPPKDKALYLTLKYDESGKLVDMQMPQPLKVPGTRANTTPFVEVNGEVYSLPVNKGKLEELQQEVAKNNPEKKLFVAKQVEYEEASKKFAKIPETSTRENNENLGLLAKLEQKHQEKHPELKKQLEELEKSYKKFDATYKEVTDDGSYKRTEAHAAYSAAWKLGMQAIDTDPSKLSEVKGKLQKQQELLEIDIKVSNPKTDPKERTKEVHKAINGLQDYFDKLPDEHAKEQKKKFAKLKSKFDKGVDSKGQYDFGLSEEEAKSIMGEVYRVSSQQVKYLHTKVETDLGSSITDLGNNLENMRVLDERAKNGDVLIHEGQEYVNNWPQTVSHNINRIRDDVVKKLDQITDTSFQKEKDRFNELNKKFKADSEVSLDDPQELKEFAELTVAVAKKYPDYIKQQQKQAVENLDRSLENMDQNVEIDVATRFKRAVRNIFKPNNTQQKPVHVSVSAVPDSPPPPPQEKPKQWPPEVKNTAIGMGAHLEKGGFKGNPEQQTTVKAKSPPSRGNSNLPNF